MKRNMLILLAMASSGVAWLGLQCLPEPDLSLNLLSFLQTG